MGLGAPFANPKTMSMKQISKLTGVKIESLAEWTKEREKQIFDKLSAAICQEATAEMMEILYRAEDWSALINVLASLIALRKVFGGLKTVQRGYDKFVQAIPEALDYVDKNGAKKTYLELRQEMDIGDLEFEDFDINDIWDTQKHVESVRRRIAASGGTNGQ